MLRRSPRSLVLWAGAAVLALVTAVVVASDLAALHAHARALGPERTVVVARRDLALGATVAADDLTVRRLRTSQLPTGALLDRGRATGATVRFPVARGNVVTRRHVVAAVRGLSDVLPPGTRAVRVVTADGVRPRPGEAVDVSVTTGDALGTGRAGATTLLAPGALVLAVDDASEGATRAIGVTLLVDEDDAPGLAGAGARGSVHLALVPPEDARAPSALTPR